MNNPDDDSLCKNPIQQTLTADTLQNACDALALLSCSVDEAIASGSAPVGDGMTLIIRWVRSALENEIEKCSLRNTSTDIEKEKI